MTARPLSWKASQQSNIYVTPDPVCPRADPFDSENNYALFKAQERLKPQASHRTFHPFAKLPTELKLEVLRWVEDEFASVGPDAVGDLLFAVSDRSFRPNVRDIVGLHFKLEMGFFPFTTYKQVESSWTEHKDSQWLGMCHREFGCRNSRCTSGKINAAPCSTTGIGFRWYHYIATHVDCLKILNCIFRDELGMKSDNYALLLRLWPYLPTENSIGVQTYIRRKAQLQYLATLSKCEREDIRTFIADLAQGFNVFSPYARAKKRNSILHCVKELWNFDAEPTQIPRLNHILWHTQAYTVCVQQFLLSLPLESWLILFYGGDKPLPRGLPVIWRRSKTISPRMPTYVVANVPHGLRDVEVRIPGHLPHFALYDSFGIFRKAVEMEDGEVFDLDNWRRLRKEKGPETYRFQL